MMDAKMEGGVQFDTVHYAEISRFENRAMDVF